MTTLTKAATEIGSMNAEKTAHQTAGDLASFRRFSRVVRRLITGVMIAVPLLIALYVFGFSEELGRHEFVSSLNVVAEPLNAGWAFAAFLVLLAAVAPVLYALNAARRLFGGYAAGRVFTIEAAVDIRRVAIGLLAGALAGPLAGVALSLVLTGAGRAHGVALSFGSDQLLFALFGLIILGIARVMREAAALAEDNAAIV